MKAVGNVETRNRPSCGRHTMNEYSPEALTSIFPLFVDLYLL